MSLLTKHYVLNDESATNRLATALSKQTKPGDCIALSGHIGAGKSAFARAFIRALFGADTEVPSPTFTLVQIYEGLGFDVWHADLYRLTDTQDAIELGLIDAFETAVCLIEWPEILAPLLPQRTLKIEMSSNDAIHTARLIAPAEWAHRIPNDA